jgi:ABC-type Fe3+ transport system permease subunit
MAGDRILMKDVAQYFQVLGFTFLQAFASAVSAMAFGFLGAMGLSSSSHSKKAKNILTAFALVPNTLPIIFVIFSFMKYLPLARGFIGIVAIHTFLNAGLAALAIFQLLQSKVGTLAELAYIDNCKRLRFIFRVVLPYF